jgi:lipoate-protein ligase A
MKTVYLLNLENWPILSQLEIEEGLLRADQRNWCILNHGSTPAIVMGISGKAEKLFCQESVLLHKIPVIRRFSGGGTVVVDQNTLFATFIFNHQDLSVQAQPESIMRWTEQFYRNVFPHPEFRLKENDFVIGEKKFGGNAQYLRKDRWLHHTSFLWDYNEEKMNYLKLPEKTPQYRQNRNHEDFLCTLKEHHASKEDLLNQIQETLRREFQVIDVSLSDLEEVFQQDYRKTTTLWSPL